MGMKLPPLSSLPLSTRRPIDLPLCTRDIEYATSGCRGMALTHRNLDPCTPRYRFAESLAPPPPELRFSGRVTNEVRDIDKASPAIRFRESRGPLRDPLDKCIENSPRY